MNEKHHAVFVIKSDTANQYGINALKEATQKLQGTPGFVNIASGVFMVDLRVALPVILALYVRQQMIRSTPNQTSWLDFALIPCGTQIFGEYSKEEVQALGALGLEHWETFPPVK